MPTPPEEQEQELSPYPLATESLIARAGWESLKHASAPTIGITQQNTNDKNDDLIEYLFRHEAFGIRWIELLLLLFVVLLGCTICAIQNGLCCSGGRARRSTSRRRGAYRRAANDEEWERGVEDVSD